MQPYSQGKIAYVATYDLNLRKTQDGGATFTTLNFSTVVGSDLRNPDFRVLKIDPNNSNTIYVGVVGTAPAPRINAKGALFKSTDGGANFGYDLLADCHQNHPQGDWQDCAIDSLAIDPNDSNVLWVGQNGWNATYQTLMRSTDGGQTWQPKLSSQIGTFTTVAVSSSDSDTLWVLLQQQLSGQNVYRTTDGGSTWVWSQIDNTLNTGDRALALNTLIPLAAWGSGGSEGLKQSIDGSSSWQPLNGSQFHALVSLEPNVLYGAVQWPLGTASIQVSVDGGINWINIGEQGMIGIADPNNSQPISVVPQ